MKKMQLAFFIVVMFCSLQVNAQTIKVTGTVQDAKGQPVSGASVSVSNANQSTATDAQGVFSFAVKPGVTINISAVGFADTSIVFSNDEAALVITMRATVNSLSDVVVSGKSGEESPSPGEAVINDQIVSNALDEFVKSNGISEGTAVYSGVKFTTIIVNNKPITGLQNVSYTFIKPVNLLNGPDGLPAFHTVEDTRGSRYLYDRWAKGMVVNQNNEIISNKNFLFNYDKITGNLLITQDSKTFVALDKQQIKSFALKNDDVSYIYERVPAINENVFFQLISKGSKYAAYKMITTKFEKANYISNGLTESGHNYDLYIDAGTYFMVDVKAGEAKEFSISKKSLRETLPTETQKLHKYFSQHSEDDLNEDFVKGLVGFLNK